MWLYPLVSLGLFGAVFGAGLAYASKKFAVVVDPQRGMTLLDYFAARALQALVAREPWGEERTMASRAYSIAEAMLAERTHRL